MVDVQDINHVMTLHQQPALCVQGEIKTTYCVIMVSTFVKVNNSALFTSSYVYAYSTVERNVDIISVKPSEVEIGVLVTFAELHSSMVCRNIFIQRTYPDFN